MEFPGFILRSSFFPNSTGIYSRQYTKYVGYLLLNLEISLRDTKKGYALNEKPIISEILHIKAHDP